MALCANRVMVQKTHLRSLWPALAALALSFIFVGLRLSNAGWDALALVELPHESEGVTAAPKGYDGLFAQETGIFFWAAMLAAGVLTSASRKRLAVLGIGGLAFAIWQVWLWSAFGQPGIGSGGALATPFEWFPFVGLWRIAAVSIPVFLLYLVIFGPSILFPTVWGIIVSLRAALAGARDPEVWGLLLNAAIIPFLPFSTFREPLGIVRVASGLVLATVLFAARYGLKRPLNYSLFWSGMLVILLNG